MTELENLKLQIRQLNVLIDQEKDESRREELIQTKNDLEELLSLMEEEEEEKNSGEGTSEEVKKDDEIDEDDGEDDNSTDNLLGSRCLAPYDSDRSLPLHTAIIMDIESSTRVRVLFSHPTCPAMKPCTHFLGSNCRFNENCRFSHGYSVELERIEDYQEPDYSLIVEQGLVLVKGPSELWEMGRISAIDGQQVAVKLLKSGNEVSAKRKDLVPLGEIEKEEKKDDSWNELKQETLGRVSVGDIGKWNGGEGVGMKLMMKMGYKVGEGLGKRSDGIVHAIQARICAKMFQKKSERTFADLRKETEEMAGYSSKTLASKNIDLESELRQMIAKQKKLKDGIIRNKNDKNTVIKMTASLREVDEKISIVNRKLNRIQNEVASRNSKKKDDF
ncbi:hypothetical protein CAEBREN_17651 [Caenorhabditis brenneri]|uniref:Zinc finger CCCH-type with G patch domain-containing protein n=1 Tax=Caenorhabditis brenneri TaxID=135651 RepID=G0P238_CAEBE|nr:hypothetical protein CAEBREN_17651 [Caenorhabditis brenneri]